MINSDLKLKLNRDGDIDLLHYQRMAEKARSEALQGLLLALVSKLKKAFTSLSVKVRTLKTSSLRPSRILTGSVARHVH